MLRLPQPIQYASGRSLDWSGSVLVNCYPEAAGADKRSQIGIIGRAGYDTWSTVGTGVRGMHVMDGVLYVVSGGFLFSINSSGTETNLGAIGGTGPVRFADNGAELGIVGGTTGYVYSGSTLQNPLAYNVSDVAYLDGYMIWSVSDSDQFFISALDDALTYDAADIAVVEGSPDILRGMQVNSLDIFMIGEKSIEIYYNSGDPDFPFNRQGNAFIPRGCVDRDSIVSMDNTVYFVGDDRVVYRLDGYRPERISTHDVEYHLADATSYVRSFTDEQEGHKFYCMTLGDSNGDIITLCYDAATGLWHQRQSYNVNGWTIQSSIEAYGFWLWGDGASGNVFQASLDVYDDNGTALPMDIYLPTIDANRERLTCYSFEMLCETGVGNGDVANPTAVLRRSTDGRHVWSNEGEHNLGTGAVGQHVTRAIWRRLGRFRQLDIWIRITDAAKRMVIGFYMDAR